MITLIAPGLIKIDQQVVLAGQVARVANVRDGRDAGGDYKIVVVEFSEELYADFRFYGDLSIPFFEEYLLEDYMEAES
jgi:hypothetical protein